MLLHLPTARETELDPGVLVVAGLGEHATLERLADDLLERGAGPDETGDIGTRASDEVLPVLRVAQDDPVVLIEQDQPFGHRLDRVLQLLSSAMQLLAQHDLPGDVARRADQPSTP